MGRRLMVIASAVFLRGCGRFNSRADLPTPGRGRPAPDTTPGLGTTALPDKLTLSGIGPL